MNPLQVVLVVVVGYLIGSLPTAYLLALFVKKINVFEVGSGNMGGTNVARAMGLQWGILTALIDCSKGMAAVYFARLIMPEPFLASSMIGGLAAVSGHNWSFFGTAIYSYYHKKFSIRGGKGAATALGTMIMLCPPEPIILLLTIGILLAIITRYASLSVLAGFAVALIWTSVWAIQHSSQYLIYLPYVGALAFLIVWRFRENIQALLAGTERKLGEQVR